MVVFAHGEFVVQAFVSCMEKRWLFRQHGYRGSRRLFFCSDEFGGTKIGRSRWGGGGALGSIWS